jgi:hypothetical protein
MALSFSHRSISRPAALSCLCLRLFFLPSSLPIICAAFVEGRDAAGLVVMGGQKRGGAAAGFAGRGRPEYLGHLL